jgi:lipoate-protein ligase A
MRIRYLDDPAGLSTAEGLAGDETLALSVSAGQAPPTLRLYTYRPCVIVGRYQNLTDSINLDVCRARGLEWNRRHTGGGTVLMGPDQLAVALVLPDTRGRFPGSIRRHFEFFAGVLGDALRSFGIQAELQGKNDLQVDGRKIAGLAISQDVDDVVFFHASLLLDFDIPLMVNALCLPTGDLDDRGQSCFSQRMTTLREHAPHVRFEPLKAAVAASLDKRMGLDSLTPGAWQAHERDSLARLVRERYANDDWIYSSRVMRRWNGTCTRKTPGGAIRVYVSVSGTTLEAVLVTGDYFCRGLDLARLEAELKGTPLNPEALRSAIATHECQGIYRVETEELADMVLEAAAASGPRTPMTLTEGPPDSSTESPQRTTGPRR